LDLHNKEQESTSHQATLVTGRRGLIYTIHQDGAQGRTPHGQIYPKRRDIAVSHRSWPADIISDRATEGTQGTAPRGRK
jgi:hypothetical protein